MIKSVLTVINTLNSKGFFDHYPEEIQDLASCMNNLLDKGYTSVTYGIKEFDEFG